jgi:GNAT superfamily N-acetyltransferase
VKHRPETTIRSFAPGDLDPVWRLIGSTIDSAYSGVYPERAIAYFKRLHSGAGIAARAKEGTVLVVERDGAIIGTGSLIGDEIGGVFVRRDVQGQGIGTRLMDELEERASAAGLASVSLSVSLPSRAFYVRRGYSVSGMLSGDMGCGQTLDYWQARKSLEDAGS